MDITLGQVAGGLGAVITVAGSVVVLMKSWQEGKQAKYEIEKAKLEIEKLRLEIEKGKAADAKSVQPQNIDAEKIYGSQQPKVIVICLTLLLGITLIFFGFGVDSRSHARSLASSEQSHAELKDKVQNLLSSADENTRLIKQYAKSITYINAIVEQSEAKASKLQKQKVELEQQQLALNNQLQAVMASAGFLEQSNANLSIRVEQLTEQDQYRVALIQQLNQKVSQLESALEEQKER